MDQIKIGKFIAACRKEQGMTQAALAEKLGISDRAVSKWETGKSMPDSGIMLELCSFLGINVNELLSGEKIMTEVYDKRAEENLLEMRRQVEEKNRQLLRTEYLIVIPVVAMGLVLILVAGLVEMSSVWRGTLIFFAVAMIVPTYWQANLAPHIGRTRYMKCPACGKWSYQKKVLTKGDEGMK